MTYRLAFLSLLLIAGLASPPLQAGSFASRDDVRDFIDEMSSLHGFDRADLSTLFAHTRPVPAAIKLIMPPKDPGVRSWRTYRSRFVEPRRIAAGRRFMQAHESHLAEAERQFGVPREIIAAVIGVETIFGKHMGRFGTFAVLSTLAFDYPPRAALFRKELEELLLLARDERRNVLDYTGSYAGAIGLPQFLPSSVRRYALDFDGNGKIDLARSPVDAIGSVARFLSEHGWERDGPIAVTIKASGPGVDTLIAEGILPQRKPSEMQATGLLIESADATAAIAEQPAALIDLTTPDAATEFRLGYRNFYVITRYNRSNFYAASVMDLAAALREPARSK